MAHASNITPDVIFGTGNANGSWTVDQDAGEGMELGLRAKLRFNAMGQPENTFNWDGNDTYTFFAGVAPGGFSSDTPVWNFEWSINTDYNGNGSALSDYRYELSLDADPGAGTNFLTFDPVQPFGPVSCTDAAIGTNATGNGGGTSVTCTAPGSILAYQLLIGTNNVAQNSANYDFFNAFPPLTSFDPTDVGIYTIQLSAFDAMDNLVAMTSIDVNVEAVPVPGAALLMGGAMAGFGALRRRAKK